MTDRTNDAPELPLGADLADAMRAWLTHLRHERGHAEKTLEAYERDLRQFLAYLQAHLGHTPCLADLAALQLKTVRAFLAARRNAPACGPVSCASCSCPKHSA